ncbi:glycosyl hydrolase family 61-domain-containing protein [Roridomyces roridus]|uniref:lytic cellulose monooxygenase (C4-dehydrogenating) n=1 Tax=Roridomyces roridus TaxID=1738132 RepID=A0AAD7B4H0_9AGAR|nr:glycosyl hydrolase family 61-domain-containing protein [Roridomyces roridus]
MKSALATLFTASLIASTAAHGWIGEITIGGKVFSGNKPTQLQPSANPSVVRQIVDNQPVKDVTSAELTCGRSAQPAALVATAKPGDEVLVDWKTANANGLWFHDVGPMMTYMASCGSESCADFDASKAKWFKISEQGQDASGAWAQAKLDTGSPAKVTLPSNLKAGNYLLRHEIIALHTAMTAGNAEFYPNCVQLKVTGSGTGVPASSELVSLPGAYKAQDKGILLDVYNMNGAYQFPGPPVAAFVSGGSAPKDDAPTSSSKAAATPSSTVKATPASSSKAVAEPSTPIANPGAKPTASSTSTSEPKSTSTPSSSTPKTCRGKRSRSRRAPADVVEHPDVPVSVVPDTRRSRVRAHRALMPRRESF